MSSTLCSSSLRSPRTQLICNPRRKFSHLLSYQQIWRKFWAVYLLTLNVKWMKRVRLLSIEKRSLMIKRNLKTYKWDASTPRLSCRSTSSRSLMERKRRLKVYYNTFWQTLSNDLMRCRNLSWKLAKASKVTILCLTNSLLTRVSSTQIWWRESSWDGTWERMERAGSVSNFYLVHLSTVNPLTAKKSL